jgi:hypothetical protein
MWACFWRKKTLPEKIHPCYEAYALASNCKAAMAEKVLPAHESQQREAFKTSFYRKEPNPTAKNKQFHLFLGTIDH